jgi:two-component system response regulator NreC
VLIADDHEVVVEALRALIDTQPDLRVVATANDTASALERARATRPDVAIVDVAMPEGGGFELVRRFRETELPTRVVILTMYGDDRYVLEAVRLGVLGYVVKRAGGSELLDAVRSAGRGEPRFPPSALRLLVARERDPDDRRPELSAREREVLRYTARGFSNQEIAARLYISPKTVDTYRARIMSKLDMHRRSDLVEYALRTGLIEVTA